MTVTPLFERMTIEESGARLIRHLVTKGRNASTTVGYESYLRVHVVPFFGEKPIGDITKEDLEEFVAVCLDNDQSIKSTRNYLGFLHGIFDFALREGWVIANPCKSVEKPEVTDEDQDIRFLDQAELDALLAAAGVPRSRRGRVRRSGSGACGGSATARGRRGSGSGRSWGSRSRRRSTCTASIWTTRGRPTR